MNSKGKISFITGASSGIGRACAETFAQAGSDLILAARRISKLEELSKSLIEKYNVRILNIELDVRDRKAVALAVENIPAEFKNIDILINNAGLARGLNKFHEADINDWEEMIDTNVKGLLYVSRAVLPGMVERGSGDVINIGSLAGHEVYPAGHVYCGTKHAVKAISKGMTIDLNGTGVRVCSLDPGLVETDFSNVRFHGDTGRAEKVYQGYKPLEGKDIAGIALFCVSLPHHVNIQDILVTPTAQATSGIVDKH